MSMHFVEGEIYPIAESLHGSFESVFVDGIAVYRVARKMHLQAVMNSRANGLCSFDTFGMVVRASGGFLHDVHLSDSVEREPRNRADAHSGSVAETIVRLRGLAMHPLCKRAAVTSHRMRIAVTPIVQGLAEVTVFEKGIGYGNRTDGVIRKTALWREQLKVVIISRVELKAASYYVSYDCA